MAATTYEMLCGGAVMLPLGLVTMGELEPSGRSVAAWLYLVVFGSLVAYTAYVLAPGARAARHGRDVRLREPGRRHRARLSRS